MTKIKLGVNMIAAMIAAIEDNRIRSVVADHFAGKLSYINPSLNSNKFKALASGEPWKKNNNRKRAPRADLLLNYFRDYTGTSRVVTTKQLSKALATPWRGICDVLRSLCVEERLRGLGWRYVSCLGRDGARFERVNYGAASYAKDIQEQPCFSP